MSVNKSPDSFSSFMIYRSSNTKKPIFLAPKGNNHCPCESDLLCQGASGGVFARPSESGDQTTSSQHSYLVSYLFGGLGQVAEHEVRRSTWLGSLY